MNGSHNLWISWWQDADLILRGTFAILVGLSVLSWTVIVYKWGQIAFVQKREQTRGQGISAITPPPELAKQLSDDELSQQLHKNLQQLIVARRDLGVDRESLESAVELWMRGRRMELENHLAILATTGNTSPFIGLFGTVWGIMHALQSLGGAQMLSLQMVAGPVAEALVSTAAGLFAAIPAVMAYNFFVRKLRNVAYLMDKTGNAIIEATLSQHPRQQAEPTGLSMVRGG